VDQGISAGRRGSLGRSGEPAYDGVARRDLAVEGEEVGVVGDVDGDLVG